MRFSTKYLHLFATAMILVCSASCAKSETETSDAQYDALRNWMAENYPSYPEVEPGLFYQIIPGETGSTEKPDSSDDWIFVNYRGRDLQGNNFANTYKPMAKYLGTYLATTHYIPLIFDYEENTTAIPAGILYALANMNVGDSVDAFMTYDWGYGTGGTGSSGPYTGMGGNVSISPYKAARISMRFIEMTNDPLERERQLVTEYAVNVLGLAAEDSIKNGFYVKIIDSKPEADTIATDTQIYVTYTGYFMDGFVFDTNDRDIAVENDILKAEYDDYGTETYVYDPASFYYETSEFIDGFNEAIMEMRAGERAIAIFTSEYGYGEYGSLGYSSYSDDYYSTVSDDIEDTDILPYEPMIFDITIEED